VARRSIHQVANPSFVLKLDTLVPGATSNDEKNKAAYVFEADSAAMQHLEAQLTAAVSELDHPHTVRTMKYIK
jgi:hypothetical protein